MNTVSDNAIAIAINTITERSEGCKLQAYQDTNGIWTIGWGQTGPDIVEGTTWTQKQADDRLMYWMRNYVAPVLVSNIVVQLTDHQNAAILDFVYNCGAGNFKASTLLRDLDASNFADVPTQLERWVYDQKHHKLAGLLARRLLEAKVFETPDTPAATPTVNDAAAV